MVIEIKCASNIVICRGYRPHNTNTSEFLTEYETLLANITGHKQTDSIIGIDHNLDFIKTTYINPHRSTLKKTLIQICDLP